jgi:hypothetical protein
MSRCSVASLILAMGFVVAALSVNQQPSPDRLIALTFDDLPYVAVNSAYLPGAQRATKNLLDILAKHRAPAIGFVNERQLEGSDRDARIALLRQWIDRGMTLGNHTYSHPDFNTVTIEQFQDEILKGEGRSRDPAAARGPATGAAVLPAPDDAYGGHEREKRSDREVPDCTWLHDCAAHHREQRLHLQQGLRARAGEE